jgi:MerR family transcriptional regulator/heat shock protein HspR
MNPDEETVYTLEVIARISGVDAETILHYQEQGFIRPLPDTGNRFDDEALRKLRRIEHLRATCGVNETGLRFMLDLLDEVERLKR